MKRYEENKMSCSIDKIGGFFLVRELKNIYQSLYNYGYLGVIGYPNHFHNISKKLYWYAKTANNNLADMYERGEGCPQNIRKALELYKTNTKDMKSTFLKIKFIFLFALIALQTSGQLFRPKDNYPSPNAASLGEYGKIPVSLFTGQPNISIPLYVLKEGNLSLPISMNYNLASVKPNRRSGWVGLGWNLSAGGCITRNVRGCYDEKQLNDGKNIGFYSNYFRLQSVNNGADLGNHAENFMGSTFISIPDDNIPAYELMTDEYNFVFGDYSGSFYLDEQGKWIVVSDYDIKVDSVGFRTLNGLRNTGDGKINVASWANNNENNRFFDVFTLITPDGVKYTFGGRDATEYSISYYNRNNSDLIPTSWWLSKIESPKRNAIVLEYEAGLPVCEIQFSAYSAFTYLNLPDPGSLWSGNWLNPGDVSYSVDNTVGIKKLTGYLIFPVYLKAIKTPHAQVNFHSGELLTEQELLPYAGFMAWQSSTSLSSRIDPIAGISYDPANQFHVFMPNNDITKIQTEYIHGRVLRAITIKPLDAYRTIPANDGTGQVTYEDFTTTYYMEYTRNTRRHLTCIAERTGDYAPVEDWRHAGNMLVLYYLTPEAVGYTPKEYHFEYNVDKVFPRYIFASTDHWGYYNGYTEAIEEGERSFSIPYLFDQNFYNSRNAAYNMSYAKAETLKEIKYPTGGRTCFEYE